MRTNRRQNPFSCMIRRGFTLVDVSITVLIMGLLAAVATPAFTGFLQQTRADAAAKRIRADLSLARQTALAQSQGQVVQFSPGTASYSLPQIEHPDHPGEIYDVDLSPTPYHSSIQSAVLGIDGEIHFNRFGSADSGGVITVQSGLAVQTVTIEPDTGRATVP